jgi:putative aldouronate transport system substrate-binding protein
MHKKLISPRNLAALGLSLALLAGCGTTPAPSVTPSASASTSASASAAPAASSGTVTDTAPEATGKIADGDVVLTYWGPNHAIETYESYDKAPLYMKLEEMTGVKIEFKHPPLGQEAEQFNLMIASNDLTDMIETNWLNFPGGPEKALNDGILIKLNDIFDNTAVNLKGYLDANPVVEKLLKTDTGSFYAFPFVRGDELLMVSYGPQIRKDWLDDLGLPVPTTIDEWTTTLQAFKDEKGADAPLSVFAWALRNGRFGSFITGAYGIGSEFYLDGSTVRFGPIEPAFKQALQTFRTWYADGLLDPDYAAQDSQAYNAKITGGRTGAFLHATGGGMGNLLTNMKDDPSFDLIAAPWPVLNKGETPRFGLKDFPYYGEAAVGITSACNDVETAAKWLDFGYSEAGHMLYNFGIEGESYEMKDGEPLFTDLIANNPDGLSFAVSARRYMRSVTSGPFVQDVRYFMQYMQYPQQKEALKVWAAFDGSTRMPPITPTPDESNRLASIMTEVDTYINEEMLKFIMGQKDLNEFDQFVEQIKKMGIEEALQLKQAAIDRFNAR